MTCMLCGQPIDATVSSIPTTDGQWVHIACADRAARVASQRRAIRAGITACSIAGVLLIAALRSPPTLVFLMLLFGVLLHTALNRYWWQFRVQAARLRLWQIRHSRWRWPRR